jgi:hypothetical protein
MKGVAIPTQDGSRCDLLEKEVWTPIAPMPHDAP